MVSHFECLADAQGPSEWKLFYSFQDIQTSRTSSVRVEGGRVHGGCEDGTARTKPKHLACSFVSEVQVVRGFVL